MAQQTFMTPQALQFSLKQNAMLVGINSVIRIAAFAQPVPHKGSWEMVRLNWTDEPDRVASFTPKHATCNCN